LVERGYKGKIYQTHGAATRDLMRLGGKAVDGSYVSSATVVVAEQLGDSNALKPEGMRFVTAYEKVYGPNTRNALSAHGWDGFLILDAIVPAARKKASPGTSEFRAALREALETTKGIVVTGGVLAYTPNDHWGYKPDVGIVMKIVNSDWILER
jgi:branched-chain amino acid transport system substrate-binding protein